MKLSDFKYDRKTGEAPNKGTAFIGGSFNVSSARTAVRAYIKDTLGEELGTINAQFPYSAIAEVVVLHIIRSTTKYNAKSASHADLYVITLDNLRRGIRDSNEYGPEIKSLEASYVPTAMNYVTTFFDEEKVLKKFIVTQAFTGTKNVEINKDALNFVCYILSHTMCNLTRVACLLSKYANKKNVQIKNFTYACEWFFTGEELRKLLAQRLSEIEMKFANDKGKGKKGENAENEGEADADAEDAEDEEDVDEEEEDAEEDAEVEDDETEKPKGKSKKPPTKKTTSKKATKDVEENEDENIEENIEENEEAEENEDVNEEENADEEVNEEENDENNE